jgi:hypothetical protein
MLVLTHQYAALAHSIGFFKRRNSLVAPRRSTATPLRPAPSRSTSVPCARCQTAYCIFCRSPLCLTKSDQLTLVSQVNVFTGWLAQTQPHGDDDCALHSRPSTCAFDRHLNIYFFLVLGMLHQVRRRRVSADIPCGLAVCPPPPQVPYTLHPVLVSRIPASIFTKPHSALR